MVRASMELSKRPVGLPTRLPVDQRPEHIGARVVDLRDRRGRRAPQRRVVERGREGQVELVGAELSCAVLARGPDGVRLEPGAHLSDRRSGVGAERAVRRGVAQLDEACIGRVEALRLGEGDLFLRRTGAHRAVEHQGARRSGEHRGVGRADRRAVGEAEVGQLLVADRLTDQVQVGGDIRGAHVREQIRRAFPAPLEQLLLLLDRVGDLVGVVGREVPAEAVRLVVVVDAGHRRAGTHATGIERHQIEAIGDRRRHHLGHAGEELDAGRSGAAGVDHQRTDPLLGGTRRRGSGELELDGRTIGVVVVQGDLETSTAKRRERSELLGRRIPTRCHRRSEQRRIRTRRSIAPRSAGSPWCRRRWCRRPARAPVRAPGPPPTPRSCVLSRVRRLPSTLRMRPPGDPTPCRALRLRTRVVGRQPALRSPGDRTPGEQ